MLSWRRERFLVEWRRREIRKNGKLQERGENREKLREREREPQRGGGGGSKEGKSEGGGWEKEFLVNPINIHLHFFSWLHLLVHTCTSSPSPSLSFLSLHARPHARPHTHLTKEDSHTRRRFKSGCAIFLLILPLLLIQITLRLHPHKPVHTHESISRIDVHIRHQL